MRCKYSQVLYSCKNTKFADNKYKRSILKTKLHRIITIRIHDKSSVNIVQINKNKEYL